MLDTSNWDRLFSWQSILINDVLFDKSNSEIILSEHEKYSKLILLDTSNSVRSLKEQLNSCNSELFETF